MRSEKAPDTDRPFEDLTDDQLLALLEERGTEAIAIVRRQAPSLYVRAIALLIGD